ncbi:MAG: collagen triple helix repeat [Verrucomicrobia bacterium]|jgi:hypothetical protein|nr:collagen triple helix repeat [Verrucomicrobiota bacterium]
MKKLNDLSGQPGLVSASDRGSAKPSWLAVFRPLPGSFRLIALLAVVLLQFGTASVTYADRSPTNCIGSGLGLNLFTNLEGIRVGDRIYYGLEVFNGVPNSVSVVCDASAIQAFIVTPDGVTNSVALSRTLLHNGESDFYPDVVSYIVRVQDILPDSTVRAVALGSGTIHQGENHSTGGGFQGVNTEIVGPPGTNCVCINGTNGLNGATGPMGLTGLTGPMGLPGLPGLAGINGINGTNGLNGVAGTNGLPGTIGPMGLTGLTGPMGLPGLPGPAGINGINGTNGLDGVAGTNGLPGAIGLTGLTGLTGPMGLPGLPGPAGINGINGTNGLNGVAGTNGVNGINGTGSTPQYGYFFNLSAQAVALEAAVTFSNTGVHTAGITHGVGSSDVVLVSAGDYKINFSVSATEPNQFALFLNGVAVASSIYGSGAGVQQNTGQVILTAQANDVLTLRNHASAAVITLAAIPPIGGTASTVNASLLIQKLN